MSIDIFFSTNFMLLGQIFTLKRCFLIILKKSLEINLLLKLQSPINQKEKHVAIRRNSKSTLMKYGAPSFLIDIIYYMIYLDVKYFSVVCLGIYYEKCAPLLCSSIPGF